MFSAVLKIQVYLANTSWMMAEKIVGMGLVFAVTAVLARYLGPEQFGILSYAISLVAIFSVAGHVGLSGLVVRELVKEPESQSSIMGTSFVLKGMGYLIGLISLLLTAFLTETVGSLEFWVLVIVAASLIFQPLDIIDFWFQSLLKSKYTTISRIIAVTLSSAIKLLLVFLGAHLILFAVVHLVQALITATLLIVFLTIKSKVQLRDWCFSKAKAREFLSQGWMVFLGSILAVIYLKIDQVMLKWLVSSEEVGIYAIAATLSEAWYFVPAAIVTSLFPKFIKLKQANPQQYDHRLQQLFDFLLAFAFVIAIFVTILAEPIISIFFGEEYSDASSILVVHIWASLFIFMRAAFSKWILIENVLMFSLLTQGLGAIANIGLNSWFIPIYGGVGAAYATLISYAIASYVALVFHPKTRRVFIMMTKSFFSPLRYMFFRKGT